MGIHLHDVTVGRIGRVLRKHARTALLPFTRARFLCSLHVRTVLFSPARSVLVLRIPLRLIPLPTYVP